MSDPNSKKFMYNHQNPQQMVAFKTKLRSLTRAKSEHCHLLFNNATKGTAISGLSNAEIKTASSELYDIIIDHIADINLLNTLASDDFEDKGVATMKYIVSCWSAGDNESKHKPLRS